MRWMQARARGGRHRAAIGRHRARTGSERAGEAVGAVGAPALGGDAGRGSSSVRLYRCSVKALNASARCRAVAATALASRSADVRPRMCFLCASRCERRLVPAAPGAALPCTTEARIPSAHQWPVPPRVRAAVRAVAAVQHESMSRCGALIRYRHFRSLLIGCKKLHRLRPHSAFGGHSHVAHARAALHSLCRHGEGRIPRCAELQAGSTGRGSCWVRGGGEWPSARIPQAQGRQGRKGCQGRQSSTCSDRHSSCACFSKRKEAVVFQQATRFGPAHAGHGDRLACAQGAPASARRRAVRVPDCATGATSRAP